ncbi:RrF2 family transcriptional regulator [Sneathiella sp.]|uniref:RrF2 family transcriptional regulator n=1 Tax=Sneathiella sp. TaxID=1964365 RepID=UPI0025FEBEC5|nr:Rrf2 family transcriptional regulator [Sneathiella sp.]
MGERPNFRQRKSYPELLGLEGIMRLAAFSDYGLRVMMRLADKPETSLTTGEIAREFHISYHHLTKVVQDLVRGGFLQTKHGAGGGITLARSPQSITLGEVVRYLEQRHALVECFRHDGGACHLTPKCRLKAKLFDARNAFFASLDTTTVADCAYPGGTLGRRNK